MHVVISDTTTVSSTPTDIVTYVLPIETGSDGNPIPVTLHFANPHPFPVVVLVTTRDGDVMRYDVTNSSCINITLSNDVTGTGLWVSVKSTLYQHGVRCLNYM